MIENICETCKYHIINSDEDFEKILQDYDICYCEKAEVEGTDRMFHYKNCSQFMDEKGFTGCPYYEELFF